MFYVKEPSFAEVPQILSVYADDLGVEVTQEWLDEAQSSFTLLHYKSGSILGAYTEDDHLVGVITINLMFDLYLGYTSGPYAHLETIIVKKEFQGQGVGSMLVKEAINYCKENKVTYIIAQTDETNIGMSKAYLKSGLNRKYDNFHLDFTTSAT